MPANTQEGVPPTPFACALLRKDDDPLNPGDKRGIALINVGLKPICKVLQMRIERFVETNNLLSYEQAGFRKREEFPKESLLVKKATDKGPAAPAVDPPSDMAAEITPAIQDDGATPTVAPIADVEMCL
ncbi:hypothetical protein BASA50_005216 [Batrachochytrium salamandrivorans]|uniref:Uncharacterized protein n=1 Tax=Batrachochytrium salamandrivorans TaxID=1357716 RepID=A0ABQ8FFW6_9FUNG|nr:hypothetical protein BASA60_006159 [Batrachochytrium salamandrivorans]KAH6593922.1 hypothetical protein BASA61_004141 [Batrachochytrium salamandrivorans]KAH6596176.1 hypothetical protein BASA50_005216 [Batrachochytrium salamandrivorans]